MVRELKNSIGEPRHLSADSEAQDQITLGQRPARVGWKLRLHASYEALQLGSLEPGRADFRPAVDEFPMGEQRVARANSLEQSAGVVVRRDVDRDEPEPRRRPRRSSGSSNVGGNPSGASLDASW